MALEFEPIAVLFGLMSRRLPSLSPTALRWFVVAFGAFEGAVLLLVPHRVDPVVYGGLRSASLAWGGLFFLGSLLLTMAVASRVPRRWVALAHIPVTFAFGVQSVLFAAAGTWTGAVVVGFLGLGLAVSALLPSKGRWKPQPSGDLFSATMGLIGLFNGAVILLVPKATAHSIFDLARPALWALGLLWILAAIPLLVLHLNPRQSAGEADAPIPERFRRVIHVASGLLFVIVGLLVSWPGRAWIGVGFYCGGGLVLMLLPLLRHALRGVDPVSVRTRLALALAMAAGLTLVLTVSVVTREQERQVRTQIRETLDRQAQAVAVNVSDYLNLKGARAQAAADLVPTESFDSVGQQVVVESCQGFDPEFLGCAVFDRNGVLLAEAGSTSSSVFTAAYRNLPQDGSTDVDLLLSQRGDRTLPILAARVRWPGGPGYRGTLLAALDPGAMDRRIGRSGSGVHLTDGYGRTIARELPLGVGAGFSGADGGEVLESVRRVPDLPWQVAVSQPVSRALRELYDSRETTFWLLLLMSGVVSVAGALAAASVAQPLDRLIAALEQMEAGNLEAPVQRGGLSELDRLAVAFDHMRNRLAQQTRAREDLASALEERAQVLSEQDRRKDEFLAMLAHELRNPLGAIGNTVFLMRENNLPEEERRRLLAVIERQSGHLGRMVDDLLDVSRITRGKVNLRKERVDLIPLARQVVADLLPRAERSGLTLTADIPDGEIWVQADPTRIGQVMGNLLTNAIKYTDAGGSIRVRLGDEDEMERAVFSVRDTGRGLSPELLPRVFDLFIQGDQGLDRADSGLGIGLTLVHRLVEMHGGTVTAASPGVGEGSEFVVRLPLTDPPEDPDDETANRPRGYGRVMLVDDHVDSVTALAAILEHGGHETRVCHDGEEALSAVDGFSPEAMVVDIGLPGMDGYEVARRLRGKGLGDLLLVAVTGYGRKEDQDEAFAAGFDHHLTKPVEPLELRRLLADRNS